MNGFRWCLSWFAVLSAFGGPLAVGASILTLTTNPVNGALTGAPGQTVGWGFTLANTSDNFAVITSSDFCGAVISSPCVTPLGSFTDFIGPGFTVINPHSSLTDVFNAIAHAGIGSYAVSPAAPRSNSFLGQLVLTYDTFDPTFSNQIGFDDRVTSAASISVPAPSVPESASLSLLSVALAGLYLAQRHRKLKEIL